MKQGKNNIDTGKLLRDFIGKNRITKSNLGRDIGRNGLSIFQYTQNSSIQTGILIDICHATKHNFFQDIANEMPREFTVIKELNPEKDLLIAQLQQEINVLKIQNEL